MASWAGLEVEERSPFRSLPCPSLAYLPDPYYQVIVESSISPFQKAKAIVSQGAILGSILYTDTVIFHRDIQNHISLLEEWFRR